MNNNSKYFIALAFTFVFLVVFSLDLFSSIGIGLFLFFGTKFFLEIGEKIEIRDIMILIATLQWIVGPLLAYKLYPDDNFYYMAVELHVYMGYVVPATIAFSFGLYLPFWKNRLSEKQYLLKIKQVVLNNKNLDLILIVIGSISELIKDFTPVSIRFVLFLLSGLRFIGLFFLFLSDRKNKKILVYVILAWLFLSALKDTLFHDLLLWLSFFLMIVAFIVKPSIKTKIIYFLGGVLFIVAIQTVKHSFREAISEGNGKGIELFSSLVEEKVIESNYVTSDANVSAMITRINQGWIIARIMSWTPVHEPFAEGETIMEALKSSLLPRFLFPNKIVAGGRTYFTRFTGKDISSDTSMGLGLVGEAYANYGIQGGIFFMFIIGFFYNFFLSRIFKIAIKHPVIIFFIPLLFLQVVKAETDFSVIINHLVKSTIVVVFIFVFLRKILNVKI